MSSKSNIFRNFTMEVAKMTRSKAKMESDVRTTRSGKVVAAVVDKTPKKDRKSDETDDLNRRKSPRMKEKLEPATSDEKVTKEEETKVQEEPEKGEEVNNSLQVETNSSLEKEQVVGVVVEQVGDGSTKESSSSDSNQLLPNGDVELNVPQNQEEAKVLNIEKVHIEESKCTCKCEEKVKQLETDLRKWKEERTKIDEDLINWREKLDEWLQTKFGITVTISGVSLGNVEKESLQQSAPSKRNLANVSSKNTPRESEIINLPSTSKEAVQEFFDEGESQEGEERNPPSCSTTSHVQANVPDALHPLGSKEVENVEITPDVFHHFMLQTDSGDEWNPNVDDDGNVGEMEVDDYDDGVEPTISTRTEIIKRYMDGEGNDDEEGSDASIFTLSEESSSSDEIDSSDDEELRRARKRNHQTKNPQVPVPGTSNANKKKVNTTGDPPRAPPPPCRSIDLETRNELMKLCRAKPGNLWECSVCGFLLASFENMLLHIKYNHSTCAHTCPFCRVVIICRSPKDALLHQQACKMRPSGGKVSVAHKSLRVVPYGTANIASTSRGNAIAAASSSSSLRRVSVPMQGSRKRKRVEDVHAEVNQFVNNLLASNSSSSASNSSSASAKKHLNKHSKKKNEAEIVTLSSDEESD